MIQFTTYIFAVIGAFSVGFNLLNFIRFILNTTKEDDGFANSLPRFTNIPPTPKKSNVYDKRFPSKTAN